MKCARCLATSFADWMDYRKHVLACAVTARIYVPIPKEQKEKEVKQGEAKFKQHIIYEDWLLARGF